LLLSWCWGYKAYGRESSINRALDSSIYPS
jgi:hypothetical protein